MARLNDTDAIVNKMPHPTADSVPESLSVEVRPIVNGYILRESKYDGGKYDCTETYHATKPTMNTKQSGGNMMKSATDYAKR